ncbi:MAG: substrate-binding domain-containing protein, partial [Chloroflexi bacterium]|nr:substrate-binding domain-containing protein [Chloroflexota bacterium]
MKKLSKLFAILALFAILGGALAACGKTADKPEVEKPVEEEVVADEPKEEVPSEKGAPFTIGISNPFISGEYRTQMIDNLITINEEYKALGLTKDLVIENFDTDVAGQIEQLENLINAGVDAILVNPGDAVALNQILEEAVDMGILVFSIDQEIEAKGVINVGHNQYEFARISAEWLAENLQEGNVVQIEGFIGHPANNLRM